MDGFSFDYPSPDFAAEILCATSCSQWSNLQLPWECNADDCADLTDIISSLPCIQTPTDAMAVDANTELSTPTTMDSVDSTKTGATAAYGGSHWQPHHEKQKSDMLDAAHVGPWPTSELPVLRGGHLSSEAQLFSLPLNQLGQLGDELTTLLSNFSNLPTAATGVDNCSKRAYAAESSDELQYSSGGRECGLHSRATSDQCQSFPNSGNQTDGSSTTTTTNSSPNCSGGDVNSIVLSDIFRWTSQLNSTPVPSSGARDNLKIPFAAHRLSPSRRPRLLLEEDASCAPSSLDIRRHSTGRSSHEPDQEAIAKVKEMIYRAAVMRPVTLGREAAAEKPRRRNVRISSDPQTVAARERRERISDRLRVLQRLVPGGSKMDTATMLDEACNYLKFLKAQLAAGPQVARTAAGVRKLGAAGSSLSSRYPLPPLQSRPVFPAHLETLVGRRTASQYQP